MEIVKKHQPDALELHFAGAITEPVDLAEIIGSVPKQLRVGCKDITRINSAGVKTWIDYFEGLRRQNISLRFFDCSPITVQQMGLFSNFIPTQEVESVFVPFSCEGCGAEYVRKYTLDELRGLGFKLTHSNCEACGKAVVLDDFAELYFKPFLE